MVSSMVVPVGFRFNPNDEELVGYYVYNKLFNSEKFKDCYIKEVDLYGNDEPWEVWEKYRGDKNDTVLYCFTHLKKKVAKASSSRISRTVGSGTWAGENAASRIEIPNSGLFGLKKRFRYEKEGSKENGGWFLYEYSISGYNDIVVCCLRPNNRKSKKRSSGFDNEGDEELSKRRKTELFDNCSNPVSSTASCSQFIEPQEISFQRLDICRIQQQVNMSSTPFTGMELLAPQENSFQDTGRIQQQVSCEAVSSAPFTGMGLLAPQENSFQQLDTGRIQQQVSSEAMSSAPFTGMELLAPQENSFQQLDTDRIQQQVSCEDMSSAPFTGMELLEPQEIASRQWEAENFEDWDDLIDVSMLLDPNPEVSAPSSLMCDQQMQFIDGRPNSEQQIDDVEDLLKWLDEQLTNPMVILIQRQ